jgi:hypothetical protein
MKTILYEYVVRITSAATSLQKGPLINALPNAGEIAILSKTFTEYAECERALTQLLALLASYESSLSDNNYVIVTAFNPLLARADVIMEKPAEIDSTWDKQTLLRAYVVDSETLKKQKVSYNVIGQIRLSDDYMDLLNSSSTTTQ